MFEENGHKTKKWSRTSPREYWRNISRNRHVMQVYDTEQSLIVALNCFTRSALSFGEPVIIVATGEHIRELSKSLNLFGVNTDALRLERQLILVDAEAMLAEFMDDDMPDEDKFNACLSRVFTQASISPYTPARIFGEMVSLLWSTGKKDATLALEEMWNRACEKMQLTLFCGYAGRIFAKEDHGQLIHICSHHASLVQGDNSSFTEIKFRNL